MPRGIGHEVPGVHRTGSEGGAGPCRSRCRLTWRLLLDGGGIGFTDVAQTGRREDQSDARVRVRRPILTLRWARAAVDGCFDGPWERKYAVRTFSCARTRKRTHRTLVYSRCRRAAMKRWRGVIDARLPRNRRGQVGHMHGRRLHHRSPRETGGVEEAFKLIGETVRISYSRHRKR